jgi:prophage regulatory protein
MEQALLRLADVQRRVGLKRSTVYELIRRGEFPPPIHLSRRCTAWLAEEIEAWIKARIAQSRGKNTLQSRKELAP